MQVLPSHSTFLRVFEIVDNFVSIEKNGRAKENSSRRRNYIAE